MKIKAKIIADSKNIQGDRITTFVLTFPRFLLAELNTHRMFSRNSASSRAIPFEKMVKSVIDNPFMPIAFQAQHSGMQGTEYLSENKTHEAQMLWYTARNHAVAIAKNLDKIEVTKQLCNRLLEPFMWHTVILTATDFDNFFELRCPKYDLGDGIVHNSKKDALKYIDNKKLDKFEGMFITELDWLKANKGQSEIHMMALAEAMYDEMNESVPEFLKNNECHIPFGNQIREALSNYKPKLSPNGNFIISYNEKDVLKISTAMCARVSYTTVGEDNKEFNYENDIKLHDKLLQSKHFSCFEHCAKTMSEYEYNSFIKGKIAQINDLELGNPILINKKSLGYCNNFKGFIQYRYLIDNKDE